MEFSVAFIFSQILALIALCFDFVGFQQKTKRRILLFSLVSMSCMTLHFFLLKEIVTAIVIILSITRNLMCLVKNNKKIFFFYTFIYFVSFCLTYKKVLDILPLIFILISNYALFQKEEKKTRIFLLISFFLFIIYNIIIFSPMGILVAVNLFTSTSIGYYRHHIKKKK